jgi:uncharacterized protein
MEGTFGRETLQLIFSKNEGKDYDQRKIQRKMEKTGGSLLMTERIGRVARLRRYPVKSMRGEDLDQVFVEEYGFAGDRIFAYVLDDASNPKFPWMTARQAAEMLLYEPEYDELGNIRVTTPERVTYSITDNALEKSLEEKYGYEISLKQSQSGCHDTKPVSLLGMQSVRQLENEVNMGNLVPERFRANIYAEWDSGEPFLEDRLVGKTLFLGEGKVSLRIVKKDSRCVIPTLEPTTAKESPAIFEVIKTSHGGCIGVYAEVVSSGLLRVDDVISVS